MKLRKLWWKVRSWLYTVRYAIEDNLPTACDKCGRWARARDIVAAPMTHGYTARLCPTCWEELNSADRKPR